MEDAPPASPTVWKWSQNLPDTIAAILNVQSEIELWHKGPAHTQPIFAVNHLSALMSSINQFETMWLIDSWVWFLIG